MGIRAFIGLGIFLTAAALTGCGGGDGASTPATTTISGMASKGPIKAGTVKVFAIRGGIRDSAPLKEGPTDNNGNYSIDVGSYKGAVMVEVTGGSYTDEVSGAVVNLKAPLRAVFANATTGRKTVAVTPLTEMAYKKAQGAGAFTAASIDDANAKVAAMFNLTSIVSTLPVAGGTSDDQKKYAAACGSIAQLVNDNKNTNESLDDALPRLLTQMGNEMEDNGGFSPDTFTKMNNAITKFSNSDKNRSGGAITPIPTPTGGLLKLATSGAANTIGAIDVTVIFPAGVKVKADATTGEAAADVISISGVAAVGGNKLVSAKFAPATAGNPARLHIILVNASGFGIGEFVTVRFDLDTGAGFPAGENAFSVAGFSPLGLSSATLSGITAAPAALSVDIK